ncbi:hypothetical protein EB980_20550 [Salmonella enterica]|nr:hypothetical protein [Salmonella enterica]
MIIYPRHGEQWQHIKGWKVYILGIKYCANVEKVNPEFYREVRFIYENSGEYTEMPFNWFREVYRKISDKGIYPQIKRNSDRVPLCIYYRSDKTSE